MGEGDSSQTGLQRSTPACHTPASSSSCISSTHRSRMVSHNGPSPLVLAVTLAVITHTQPTHSLTHTRRHTHPLAQRYTSDKHLCVSDTHTHILSHTSTHSFSQTLSHTRTHSLTNTHSFSHTQAHTLYHTDTLSQTRTNRFAVPEYSVRSNSVRR